MTNNILAKEKRVRTNNIMANRKKQQKDKQYNALWYLQTLPEDTNGGNQKIPMVETGRYQWGNQKIPMVETRR